MNARTLAVALTASLFATGLAAQTVEPGLWEFTSSNMQVDGQPLPDLQEMLGAMAPEQRQMMEQMMLDSGVQLGTQGIRVCLTEEQAQADELPLYDPESDCRQEITERGADHWAFRFDCPDAKGEGEVRFSGRRAFTTRVESTLDVGSETQRGSMETHARWIQADCGDVRPVE
ncbi:DUF3617 domain-containing protein [Stutzerimonas tarimensis]|uniref:DUF3617 domain-containing protein n=1 Tax=Stutzerimonas tarimensis TaxID=1507735 RepID=A0ABV7T6C8_9GAMM